MTKTFKIKTNVKQKNMLYEDKIPCEHRPAISLFEYNNLLQNYNFMYGK